MNHHPNPSPGDDLDLRALREEWQSLQDQIAQRQQASEAAAERERLARDSQRERAEAEVAETEAVERPRVIDLRRHRADLDVESTPAHDVALRAFSSLGRPYSPGKTAAGDLLDAPELDPAETAGEIGVPSVKLVADPVLRVLKYGGLVGSFLLGTFGMGALFLRTPPSALVQSPLAVPAAGLGFLLAGGAYLSVVPTARRCGSLEASKPGSDEARAALSSLKIAVAGVATVMAFVDAKALSALDGARALIDPNSVLPFGMTLLVAAALSATYVVGAATLAFHEGLSDEAEAQIAAEGNRRAREWRERREGDPEVQLACEAANYANAVDARRRTLEREIEAAEESLRRSKEKARIADADDPVREDERETRARELRARLAGWRQAAHQRFRTSRGPSPETQTGGEA